MLLRKVYAADVQVAPLEDSVLNINFAKGSFLALAEARSNAEDHTETTASVTSAFSSNDKMAFQSASTV